MADTEDGQGNRAEFMTANMSKSIKYCGNQFDLVTLRFDFELGFIYCGRSSTFKKTGIEKHTETQPSKRTL